VVERPDVRELIDAERKTTLSRIESMTAEFDEIVAASAGSNGDDEHDPEGSTIAYERARVTALLLEARTYLHELGRALARLDDGRYWTCERCGNPIAPERLAARPATNVCIACATSVHPAD
jgi:RNA polymerase-binding transcription factor DksA